MIPVKLANYVLETSPLCLDGRGHEGTMYHTWWQCPKLRHFWIRVYYLIFTLTQVNLAKSQRQARWAVRWSQPRDPGDVS